MIDRRQLLLGLGGVGALAIAPVARAKDGPMLFAAARRDVSGRYSIALFSADGTEQASVALPDRGHDIAVRPGRGEIVIFARRPGRFAMVLSASGVLRAAFETAEHRHFFGHGVYSADGRLLYTTEFDVAGKRGLIGVRDATESYRQVGELPAHGTEPHDMALLPDGRTLVIADGGILTEPRKGGRELNLDTMQPALVYLDTRTGDLIERQVLPASLHRLSIRHLAIATDGTVVFGCQYRGAEEDHPALVGFHRRGEEPALVAAPATVHSAMRNYVGSVACDASGAIVAASAPRGGLVAYFDVAQRRFLGSTPIADGCGVAPERHKGAFLLTSGEGMIATGGPKGMADSTRTLSQWDNHAVLIN